MKILLLSVLIFFSPFITARATKPELCHLGKACFIGERSYHAREPDGWDGKTPLPVLLHFHGWGRQGPLIMKHGRIAGATRKKGVLLLAPNGLGRSWDFWDKDTDDVAFAKAVIEAAAKRWPIDRSKIFISGYSYGSAMAWRYACAEGGSVHTVLAISGSLPDQHEDCQAAVNIRHVHGTADTVMDFPFGPKGGVEHAVELWRSKNGCAENADAVRRWKTKRKFAFNRHIWGSCASGKSILLDVHKFGHFIPRHWIAHQLDELL